VKRPRLSIKVPLAGLALCVIGLIVPSATGAVAKLEVRVITVVPVSSGAWDRQNHNAYTTVARQSGWHLEVAPAVSNRKAPDVLDRWGREGVNLVFSTNVGFQKYMLDAAHKYPNTSWVILGHASKTDDLPNLAGYSYNTCEFGFLQGAAAALVSKSHKIGAVGSIQGSQARSIMAGVRYGAKLAVPGTRVLPRYTGSFADSKAAKEAASELIRKGADTILPVTQNFLSSRIAAQAQAAHSHYIGAYTDETTFAPKAVVTSVVLDFAKVYDEVGKESAAGHLQPGIFTWGLKEGFIKLMPFRLGFTAAGGRARALAQRLETGGIHVPNCVP
jgi:basic membrane protein A